LVIKHFTMDYHEFSIYYGILFYNFPKNYKTLSAILYGIIPNCQEYSSFNADS